MVYHAIAWQSEFTLKIFNLSDSNERKYGLTAASAAAKRGELIVLPTDTVYGLGTDAFNPLGVEKLINAKGNDHSIATPVLIGNPNALTALALRVDKTMSELVQCFWPGELTLLVKQQPTLNWDLGDSGGTVAIRMPMHPVAIELLNLVGPMAVSSANKAGKSPALNIECAAEQFSDVVSVYLDGGQSQKGQPSTILDLSEDQPRLIRLGALGLEEIREVIPDLQLADGVGNE